MTTSTFSTAHRLSLRKTTRTFYRLALVAGFLGLGLGTGFAAAFGFGRGTAVVVLRTPKNIYAAVDSKETYSEYRDGKLRVTDRLRCKVGKVGPYYSIVAGVARGTNGFDALQEVASAYTPGDDLGMLGSALRDSVPRLLVPLLNTMLTIDRETFMSTYSGQAALQLTLIGSERGSPSVVVVEFQAVPEPEGTVTLAARTMSCPGNCNYPNTGYFLGAHEAIEQAVRQNSAILFKPNEGGIEKLLRLEYGSRPDIVGGPISILKVSPHGPEVLRDGACTLPAGGQE